MIKLGETYKDKSGNDVRIICVDRKHPTHSIIGLIIVNDGCETHATFTKDGQFHFGCNSRFDLILPEDYSTYKIDEPVMVRDGDSSAWVRSYFAGVSPVDGRPCAWDKQRTSWTETTRIVWNQCRRPTKEELGK